MKQFWWEKWLASIGGSIFKCSGEMFQKCSSSSGRTLSIWHQHIFGQNLWQHILLKVTMRAFSRLWDSVTRAHDCRKCIFLLAATRLALPRVGPKSPSTPSTLSSLFSLCPFPTVGRVSQNPPIWVFIIRIPLFSCLSFLPIQNCSIPSKSTKCYPITTNPMKYQNNLTILKSIINSIQSWLIPSRQEVPATHLCEMGGGVGASK